MKKLFFILSVSALLFSCREKDKVDVYYPVLSNVKINDVAAAEHLVMAPGNMVITLSATDNMALNQVKVTITPVDFTNHLSNYGPNTGDWNHSQIINISGTAANPVINVPLPDSIAGNWNIQVDLSDDAGYLATPYIGIIEIDNANLPTVSDITTNPAINSQGVIEMSANTNLDLEATVYDEDGLVSVQARIENLTGTILDTVDIPVSGTGVTFTPNFDDAGPGYYMVVVEGIDSLGYRRKWGVHLHVSE